MNEIKLKAGRGRPPGRKNRATVLKDARTFLGDVLADKTLPVDLRTRAATALLHDAKGGSSA